MEDTSRRNNGLMIKGFQITAMTSKYQNMNKNASPKGGKKVNNREGAVRIVWRPSLRDKRTYSEVTKPTIECPGMLI